MCELAHSVILKSRFFLFVCLFALPQIKAPLGRAVVFHFGPTESFLLPGVQGLFRHQRAVRKACKWVGCEPGTAHLPAPQSPGCVPETASPTPHTPTYTL